MSVLRKDKEGISMNLPEALVYADIDHLNRIARHYQLTVNLSSKNSLIQSILQLILDQRNLEHQIKGLTVPEERYLLTLLCDSLQRYTIEDLLAKATKVLRMEGMDQIDLPSNRSLINMLLNNGWLYIDKRERHQMFSIPADLRDRLISGIKQVESSNRENIIFNEFDPRNDLLIDIRSFLLYVTREIVQLTTEGVIHKKQLQHILKNFIVFENTLEGKEWRFGYGRRFPQYPNRFAIIYDFLYEHFYIREEENILCLTEEGERLLCGDVTLSITDIYHYWIKLYKKPIRNIELLLSLITLYCHEWVDVKALELKIIDFISPFYYDTKSDVLHKRIIQPLTWFELLRFEEEDQKKYVKIMPAFQMKLKK